jgi:hypothetical protein
MKGLSQPLTNTQLEILKAFSFDLDSKELAEFKNFIAQYFANKAIRQADKIWDEKKWDENTVDKMLNTKMRKSKKQ